MVNGGYYAIESLRLEKGYRAFGRELTPDYNPVEAGLLFACKLKTAIGVPRPGGGGAGQGSRTGQRLVSVVLDDPQVMMWGGELLLRDGAAAGLVTSGGLGSCRRRLGRAGLPPAFGRRLPVTPDYVRAGRYEVNVGGRVCGATASLRPPFDPEGEKVHR